MNFDNKLLSDIESYCRLNDLDVDKFVNDLLKKAFMLEKYGEKPSFMVKKIEEKDEKTGVDIVWYQPTEEKQEEKPKFDEEYLNGLIEKATPVWSGTDADEFVRELRGTDEKEEESKEPEFKLVEKKTKKPRKRKLT